MQHSGCSAASLVVKGLQKRGRCYGSLPGVLAHRTAAQQQEMHHLPATQRCALPPCKDVQHQHSSADVNNRREPATGFVEKTECCCKSTISALPPRDAPPAALLPDLSMRSLLQSSLTVLKRYGRLPDRSHGAVPRCQPSSRRRLPPCATCRPILPTCYCLAVSCLPLSGVADPVQALSGTPGRSGPCLAP